MYGCYSNVALTPREFSRVFPVNLLASITAKILQCGKSFTFYANSGGCFSYSRVSPRKYPAMELGGNGCILRSSTLADVPGQYFIDQWSIVLYLIEPPTGCKG